MEVGKSLRSRRHPILIAVWPHAGTAPGSQAGRVRVSTGLSHAQRHQQRHVAAAIPSRSGGDPRDGHSGQVGACLPHMGARFPNYERQDSLTAMCMNAMAIDDHSFDPTALAQPSCLSAARSIAHDSAFCRLTLKPSCLNLRSLFLRDQIAHPHEFSAGGRRHRSRLSTYPPSIRNREADGRGFCGR